MRLRNALVIGGRRGRGALALMMMTTTAIGLATPTAVRPAAAQEARQIAFSIPAGSLSAALAAFGRQSGLQVTYVPAVVAGKRSPGLSGAMTASVALARLLQGSGLTHRFAGATTVTVQAAGAAAAAGAAPEGAIALDTIDVSGARSAAADEPYRTPGTSAFISGETIQRFRGTSSGEIFDSTPGVIAGSSRNGAAMDVNIRGMQGMNRVATAIDGAEQSTSTYRGYYGVDNRVYVDPDLLSGVAINKGPGGGTAGPTAIGGSVYMETLNASHILRPGRSYGVQLKGSLGTNALDPLNGLLSSTSRVLPGQTTGRTDGGGIGGTRSVSLAAAYQQENFELVGAIARRQSGNYFAGSNGPRTYNTTSGAVALSPAGPGQEVLNTSENALTLLLKGTVRFGDGHQLRLSYIRHTNEFGEIMPNTIRSGYRQLPLSEIETNTLSARYNWKPTGNDLIDLSLNSSYVSINENSLQSDSIQVIQRPTRSVNVGLSGSNTSRFATPLGGLAVTYGGTYSREAVAPRLPSTNGSYIPMSGVRDQWSAFGKAELSPQSWVKVHAGVQYMRFSVDDTSSYAGTTLRPASTGYRGDAVSPNAGITLTPMEGVQLFARYANGYRPPSIRESTWNSSGFLFNPNLRPERASTWEIGANYLRSDVWQPGDKLRVKLAYFDNFYRDYLGRAYGRVGTTWNYAYQVVNIDKVVMKGIELSGGYDARRYFVDLALNYYTNYAYCRVGVPCTDAPYQTDYMINQAPPRFTITTTVGARFFDEALTVGARHRYVSGSVAGVGGLDPNDFSAGTQIPWPAFHVVDLFAEWKIDQHMTLTVNINNLFDRYYLDPLSNANLPAPGRSARAALTAKF